MKKQSCAHYRSKTLKLCTPLHQIQIFGNNTLTKTVGRKMHSKFFLTEPCKVKEHLKSWTKLTVVSLVALDFMILKNKKTAFLSDIRFMPSIVVEKGLIIPLKF